MRTADIIWDYITRHQHEDNCYINLAKEFEISEASAKSLIMDWAFGNRNKFNQKVNELLP